MVKTRNLFRRPPKGGDSTTFRYKILPGQPSRLGRLGSSSPWLCVRSALHQGIQPSDGRTGFGAPHVKPFVRPSTPPPEIPAIHGSLRFLAGFWPKATKL